MTQLSLPSSEAHSHTISFSSALVTGDEDVVHNRTARTIFRYGAIYDLLVTLPFATPFSAKLVLGLLRSLHLRLGLPGNPVPELAPTHLLFVAFFGTIVSIWSYQRLRTHGRRVHALDTLARFAFSSWQIWALLSGASSLLMLFLVVEMVFGFAQLWAVRKT